MSVRIYGNRLIKTLPGAMTRPTASKVRQALFNVWQGTIAGCSWLDLCAGSGAMGAEALCRGAASVLGIEQSGRACTIIQQNWQQVAKPSQQIQILRGDVVQRLRGLAGHTFDRIYFDPPYASGLYLPVLEAIAQYQLLDPTGELAVEHDPALPMPERVMAIGKDSIDEPPTLQPLVRCRQKDYGSTALTFYCWDQG
jgi:16S rRNA (guanine(966)-N(2))-methyltransferase RsmD